MPQSQPDPVLDALQRSVVLLIVAVLIAVAVFIHALLPRYDWKPVTSDGRSMIIYDKWAGRFQRATFLETGRIQLSDVYTAP